MTSRFLPLSRLWRTTSAAVRRDFGVHVAVFAHPGIVIDFAEVARAGIGQECDDHFALLRVARNFQCAGNAAAARAAGENAFLLGQAAGPDETFFVVYLKDVIENFEIHGARENIFADAFDDVGEGFADLSGFDEFVVERADRDLRR